MTEQKHTFLTDHNEIENWLMKMEIRHYIIHPNLVVDVFQDVNLDSKHLKYLPIQFGKVEGEFDCSRNHLSSLKGCPHFVLDNFYCYGNALTSTKDAPKVIKGSFICNDLINIDDMESIFLYGDFTHTTVDTTYCIELFANEYVKKKLTDTLDYFELEIEGATFSELVKINYEKKHLNHAIEHSQNKKMIKI